MANGANQHTKAQGKELTDQQELFVDAFLQHGNGTAAASYAGYKHPERAALKLMSKPHIKKRLTDAMASKALQMAPSMLETLAAIALDDENVQPKDRVAAAVAILDRAGMANGKGGGPKIEINNNQNNGVSGADVARLIAATFNRGQGGAPPIPAASEGQPLIELSPIKTETSEED